MTSNILTQKTLKELLHYCPETGSFTWMKRSSCRFSVGKWSPQHRANNWNAMYAGKEAGHLEVRGYVTITLTVDGVEKRYRAHRLAVLYMDGYFPSDDTDHENHVRNDNRWINLKCATNKENHKNMSLPANNTSGVCGVSWNKKANKWRARIGIDGKEENLGSFSDKNHAIDARLIAEVKYGFHKNHGR